MENPWQHRIEQTNFADYDGFVSKWLTNPKENSSLSTVCIINGWQAEHNENQWLADMHKGKLHHFAFDSRGQGGSPKHGRLDAVQNAIDADNIISKAFNEIDNFATNSNLETGSKFLQGHCIGTMTIAALYAGRFNVVNDVKGVILLSPVSTFSLPNYIKMTYFLPKWLGTFAIKHIAPAVMRAIAPSDHSEHSRDNAMTRLMRLDHDAALRQVKEIFWKENVSDYWKMIDVPTLILVGKNDPLVRYEDSIHPYESLKYPIWFELEAPDHLLLESNVSIIEKIIPEFCNDPFAFYEKYKDLKPSTD